MRIKSITVENYKSFASSSLLEFGPGFNTIVGPNNSGKTALVEAISLRFDDRPHRSEATMPSPGDTQIGSSRVSVRFHVSIDELRTFLYPGHRQFNVRKDPTEDFSKQGSQIIEAFSNEVFDLDCILESGKLVKARLLGIDANVAGNNAFQFNLESRNEAPTLLNKNVSADDGGLASFRFAQALIQRIYFFKAERFNVAESSVGASSLLQSNAANLAQVLNALQTGNPARFKRLVGLVQQIFPDVRQITVPPISESSGTVRVSVWSIPPESERQDLALPLQESGTGIGQVLAILYVAITSDHSQPILIDEPQSFLHPGAIRKLFDILRRDFGNHQYIVTTHSPIVVSSSQPGSLMLLRKEGLQSKVELIDAQEAGNMRILLMQVGARLSDVFGADNVLWVEGRTEELCFPAITSRILGRALLGTQVVGVLNVGDLQSKHKETILRIYRRLSRGSALIPPAVAFIFDRESRSDEELADLEREGRGQILFLPRRMFENYLLEPSAIAAVLSNSEGCLDKPVSEEQVAKWLEEHRNDDAYINERNSSSISRDETWLATVDAAQILADMFHYFSDNRCEYDKVAHGLELTEWLLANRPEALEEIAQMIDHAMSAVPDEVESA